MTLFQMLLFGIVEGITEFLPISSTGHLILTARLLGLAQSEFVKSFEIAIQLGAILAVVALYWRSLFVRIEILKRVLVAFVPTAVTGFLLYKIIKRFLLGNEVVVLWALFLGGVFILVFEYFYGQRRGEVSSPVGRGNPAPTDPDNLSILPYRKAFFVGVFQSLAVIPGVSRSAATILGGLGLGIRREIIVEFSFLLAVPTMLAATGLDLMKNGASFDESQLTLLLTGAAVSFAVAVLSVRFLLSFVRKYNFISFGIYRILLSLFFWIFIVKS